MMTVKAFMNYEGLYEHETSSLLPTTMNILQQEMGWLAARKLMQPLGIKT